MTGRDFCYWLQGFFEIVENENEEIKDISISVKQAKIIRAHLNLVFKHEIDPQNLEGKTIEEQKEYISIHRGARDGEGKPQDIKIEDMKKFDFEKFKKKLEEIQSQHKEESKIFFDPAQVTFNC